jgi:hypothetical protein
LGSLYDRQDQDIYDVSKLGSLFRPDEPPVRARWRWYTIDLLGLAGFDTPRSTRVSLHRAVRTLAKQRRLHIRTENPYNGLFVPYTEAESVAGDGVGAFHFDDDFVETGNLDLTELHRVDHRWPSGVGRHLWFRLAPTVDIPEDDQVAVLQWLNEDRPDGFVEFTETLDRNRAWKSEVGRFLIWLFCGETAP